MPWARFFHYLIFSPPANVSSVSSDNSSLGMTDSHPDRNTDPFPRSDRSAVLHSRWFCNRNLLMTSIVLELNLKCAGKREKKQPPLHNDGYPVKGILLCCQRKSYFADSSFSIINIPYSTKENKFFKHIKLKMWYDCDKLE